MVIGVAQISCSRAPFVLLLAASCRQSRTRSANSNTASTSTGTSASVVTSDNSTCTSPTAASAASTSVAPLTALLAERDSSLALASEEISGLLALLRSREDSLSALELERSKHAAAMRDLFEEIKDVRGMREKVQGMQRRILELEEALETQKGAVTSNGTSNGISSSSSSSWPHTYPLSTPVSSLPASIRSNSSATAVLFDLDGTLVESKDIWYMLLNACSHALGYGELDHDVWEPTYGQSMAQNRDLFFPRSTQKEIDDFCDDHYGDYVSHLKILPGAIDALRATRDFLGGTDRMTICTNCPLLITQLIVSSVPALAEFFTPDRIICAGTTVEVDRSAQQDVSHYHLTPKELAAVQSGQSIEYTLQAKPCIDIIVRACDLIRVDAKTAIFVGDSKFDLMASMSAECFAIGIGEKGRGGNMFIDNIAQLANILVK
jgi:beta-phosphoglucomutase-like phosphatase (HAD superfamily)